MTIMYQEPAPPDPPLSGISVERAVLAIPSSNGILRDLARAHLDKWGLAELVDDALLVISELVTNAQAAAPGTLIGFRMTRRPGTLAIEVRDSGPGVAPELADEVFRHGFTTKIAESAGSRGLGLALTRQACVTRGGWVDVHNEGGAVFTAFLPSDRVVAG